MLSNSNDSTYSILFVQGLKKIPLSMHLASPRSLREVMNTSEPEEIICTITH